ncbi:MAG: cytochrome c [Armatimonadetes bacterium]|nr:cytochrome c [Armatimonadota bacterium]
MLRLAAGLLLVVVFMAGCGPSRTTEQAKPPDVSKTVPTTPAVSTPTGDKDLGKTIFTTGIGATGQRVPTEKGSDKWRANPTGCAACHGEDGRGVQTTKGRTPAITYASLREAPAGQTPAFASDEALRRAIVEGVEPDGGQLSPGMPRFKLTDEEFAALVAYLKALDEAPSGPQQGEGAAEPEKTPGGNSDKG